jgi:hypothetical protein
MLVYLHRDSLDVPITTYYNTTKLAPVLGTGHNPIIPQVVGAASLDWGKLTAH